MTAQFNPAYIGLRKDILSLISGRPRTVLDVGCAAGALGGYLSARFGSRVFWVEYSPEMAESARAKLEAVWCGDLNTRTLKSFPHEVRYDLIVCGDVLEHLVDPWGALREMTDLLEDGGSLVVSLPNIGHYTTLMSLFWRRKWPYRSRGIHDRTHLRFFTRRNLLELYAQAGLVPVREKRQLRFWESGSPIDRAAVLLDFFPFRSFLTFQYLHVLRKKG